MWQRVLRKLAGGDAWDEARTAVEDATRALEEAETQAAQIRPLIDKLDAHAFYNHIGERLNADMERHYAR